MRDMRTGKFLAPLAIAGAVLTVAACGPSPVADFAQPRHVSAPVRHWPPAPTRSTPSVTPSTTTRPTATATASSPTPTASASPTVSPTPSSPSPGGTSSAPAHPRPAGLSSKSLLPGMSFSPATLVTPPWSSPANAPGNCSAPNSSAYVNAAGLAEIDTTGADGDCVSLQSPAPLTTKPGTVWEWTGTFSSFQDWPAFWGYGNSGRGWPYAGEIDAVEGGPGASSVTWHQGTPSYNYTIGPDPWDSKRVPLAGSPDIQPGVLTTVDISFTTSGVDVYYQGVLYVHIPESITTPGNDPMYLTISEGSCNAEGANVCNGGVAPYGWVTTQSLALYA